MKSCSNYGEENTDDSKFCIKCGNQILDNIGINDFKKSEVIQSFTKIQMIKQILK